MVSCEESNKGEGCSPFGMSLDDSVLICGADVPKKNPLFPAGFALAGLERVTDWSLKKGWKLRRWGGGGNNYWIRRGGR